MCNITKFLKNLFLVCAFFVLQFSPDQALSLSKKTKKEMLKYVSDGKPGVNHEAMGIDVANQKLQEELSEKVFIKKPDTEEEKQQKESTGLEQVDVDPATKTLLSIIPKKDSSNPIIVNNDDDGIITRVITIKKNDTFIGVFKDLGYERAVIDKISSTIETNTDFNVKTIKPGQRFVLKEKIGADKKEFISLQVPSKLDIIKIEKEGDGDLKFEKDQKETESEYIYKAGKVQSSIVNLASREGIPNIVAARAIRVLSSRYNLSVDVRKGDLFEVLYEEIKDSDGKIIDPGHVLYISLKGRIINAEAFSYSSVGDRDKENFYDTKGRAYKKSILRNPMKRRYRISSGFGYRKHPVLKKRLLHSGTDFAAPYGTPIYAGGDGTISKIGRYGGYGNYIKIRHDSKWETAYGHMKKFAKGMRKWKRVKQGQLIGYVGSTGRSTGPHLHYEIIRHGKPVNSQRVSLPVGIQLNKSSLGKLTSKIVKVRNILSQMKEGL